MLNLETLFTEAQERTLRATADRIVPPDDSYPGGVESGACDYILRHLRGDLKPYLALYRDGLDGLDDEARMRHGQDFAALDAEEQDHLLRRVEYGNVQAHWHVLPKQFFNTLCQHIAEGYYSEPENGGNRGARSWVMIGFEKPQIGQEQA